jgi:hypothetical protein
MKDAEGRMRQDTSRTPASSRDERGDPLCASPALCQRYVCREFPSLTPATSGRNYGILLRLPSRVVKS